MTGYERKKIIFLALAKQIRYFLNTDKSILISEPMAGKKIKFSKKFAINFFITLFFFSTQCFSQNTQNDTTASRINSLKADTTKALEWYKAGIRYLYADTGKTHAYAINCFEAAKKTNYTKGLLAAYHLLGEFSEITGNSDLAIEYYKKAIAKCLEIGDKTSLGKRYNSLAGAYQEQGNYKAAIEYYLKSIQTCEEAGYKQGVAYACIGLGNIFMDQQNDNKALEYYNRGLKISEEFKDKKGIASALNNLGIIYGHKNEYQKQIVNYTRALEIQKELNDKRGQARNYDRLGQVYATLGDHKKAHELLNLSLKMLIPLGDKENIAIEYNNIGEEYSRENNFSKAEENYFQALKLAREAKYALLIQHIYNELSKIFAKCNDFKNAYKYNLLYTSVKDSVLNGENARQLAEMSTKYETEKKSLQIKNLNNEKALQESELEKQKKEAKYQTNQKLVFAGGFLLMIILGFAVYQGYLLNVRHRTIELEQRLLRSQMNPHFIFNSLIAIESYIYKSEPKEAGRYLSRFARLMRLILENSREEFIPLSTEIKTLEYYLELQKNRFDNTFDYSIELGENIDPDTISIPPMLAQPFIENSIEHGLKNNNRQGKIMIRFILADELIFEVTDNGIGLARSVDMQEQNKTHRSMATTITMERLTILNRRKRNKIRFNIEELKNEAAEVTGTRVYFSIPFKWI